MNLLIVGSDKSEIVDHLPEAFLYIDDAIDIPIPRRRKVTRFDLSTHAFNPLRDMTYTRARAFIGVLDAVFPEGEDTLTRKSSNFALLNALLAGPTRLDRLVPRPGKAVKDTGALDAHQKIQTLLLSPVLKRFLCNPTNFSLQGIVLAQLDRSRLSEFDCFVIANLLISNYPGQVVIPDFGFYACAFHSSLIRQRRLIAGVNFLDEVPALKNNLLLIETKLARHASAGDAEILADLCSGFARGQKGHTDFIQDAVS